jgi:hypothetical protein
MKSWSTPVVSTVVRASKPIQQIRRVMVEPNVSCDLGDMEEGLDESGGPGLQWIDSISMEFLDFLFRRPLANLQQPRGSWSKPKDDLLTQP